MAVTPTRSRPRRRVNDATPSPAADPSSPQARYAQATSAAYRRLVQHAVDQQVDFKILAVLAPDPELDLATKIEMLSRALVADTAASVFAHHVREVQDHDQLGADDQVHVMLARELEQLREERMTMLAQVESSGSGSGSGSLMVRTLREAKARLVPFILNSQVRGGLERDGVVGVHRDGSHAES